MKKPLAIIVLALLAVMTLLSIGAQSKSDGKSEVYGDGFSEACRQYKENIVGRWVSYGGITLTKADGGEEKINKGYLLACNDDHTGLRWESWTKTSLVF